MNDEKGNIELLLLLCCLVGVVLFFSFSLAIVSNDVSQLVKERNQLLKEKEKKEFILNKLKKKYDELLKRKEAEESRLSKDKKLSEVERRKLEEEKKQLEKELKQLQEEKIKKVKEEIASLINLPNPGKRKEKEDELRRLEKRRRELEEEINKILKKLAMYKSNLKKTSFDKEKKKYEIKYQTLHHKREILEREVEGLKIKVLTAGTSRFKNPLYVDCREHVVVLYPSRRVVATDEFEKRFKEIVTRHDGIVLYVRPDGFKTFWKFYSKVKSMREPKPLCYEPVEIEENLDLLTEETGIIK